MIRIYRLYRKIKSFIQRGRRGWAEEDTWDFDYYLSNIIAEGTKYLLVHQHGHPKDLTEKKWREILKEIIWTFQYLRDGYNIWLQDWESIGLDQANKNREINDKRAKKGLSLFVKYFQDLWD